MEEIAKRSLLLEYSKPDGKDDDADIAAPAAAVHADQHFVIDIDSFGCSRYRTDTGFIVHAVSVLVLRWVMRLK